MSEAREPSQALPLVLAAGVLYGALEAVLDPGVLGARAHVQAALSDLGDEHRTILVLREIEGCAYEEIAEILDLPVGTVRSRIFRARGQLKEKLGAHWGEQAEHAS